MDKLFTNERGNLCFCTVELIVPIERPDWLRFVDHETNGVFDMPAELLVRVASELYPRYFDMQMSIEALRAKGFVVRKRRWYD